jgi:uncharacterized membrane protein YjgN (DUF898 family)
MNDPSQTPQLSFHGDGKTLFKIWITNLLLTICTLGIYYPWGRANMKKYLYSSTYLGDYSFEFCGTGKQMFFGLLKFFAIYVVLQLGFIAIFIFLPDEISKILGQFAGFLFLILYLPIFALFLHGSLRYRMSKSFYRGIRFGYRGSKKTLVLSLLKYAALTLCTLGIYYSWFINNIRKYIYGNTKFGSIKFEFNGKGFDYFCKIVGGGILCGLTLGIYYFWYKKQLFNFFYGNMSFTVNDQRLKVKASATAGKYFKLIVGNFFITLFTLGLGYPFVKARNMRFICDNLELYGDIDLDQAVQTEGNYADATGDAGIDMDDAGDFFDLDLF